MLEPPDLIGYISLGINIGGVMSTKDIMPTKLAAPFQRVRDGKAREAHEVPIMLPLQNADSVCKTLYSFYGILLGTSLLGTHANNIALH